MIIFGDGMFIDPDEESEREWRREQARKQARESISRDEPPLAPALLESTLLKRGGCVFIDNMLQPDLLTSLCAEANERLDEAKHTVWPGSMQVDWRGGDPARSYAGANGGPTQMSIFASPDLAKQLSEICGLHLQMAGAGSFSYYEPGDFLALHRDILNCDITLLTCLRDTATGTSDRRGLRIYPAYARMPLTQLRSEDNPSYIDVYLDRGQTAVLLGGIVPHEVLPMGATQHRTVSVVCMTALV
jgi:hypothetical protein